MTGLYPIIRRPRRSLIPLDEPAPPVPPQAVEPPPVMCKASGRPRKKDVKAAAY